MRLLIVGSLDGHIASAGKIALQRGAKVAHVDDIPGALGALRSGQGADLLMVDVRIEIGALIKALKDERISIPVVACGIGTDTALAVKAIRAGAKEYIPLPPDAASSPRRPATASTPRSTAPRWCSKAPPIPLR